MKIDSALKIIWLSVGVLLLGCILTGIFFALDLDNSLRNTPEQTGVTIDNSAKEKSDKVKLELSYGSPIKIGNSDNYLLKVYVYYRDSDPRLKAGFRSDYYSLDEEVDEPSNLIFLDKELTPIQTLLSKKALITSIEYPYEQDFEDTENHKGMTFILYEIVMSDTDGDGQLDTEDDSDLYISDLNGANLTAITRGLTIKSVDFLDQYETILIQYLKKEENNTNLIHFARYTVSRKELTELTKLDTALKSVQELLTK